jgi:predicted nucleic acid-binding protein
MSADSFDSTVLIYLFDETDARKRRIAETLVSHGLETGQAIISYQAVQETLSFLTRKAPAPATYDDTRRFFDRVLSPLWRVMPSPALYERALGIHARYEYSFYDALIVAAGLEGGCLRLYSEDLQHGHVIEGMTIENPFRG